MLTDYVNMEQMKNAIKAIFIRLNLRLSQKKITHLDTFFKLCSRHFEHDENGCYKFCEIIDGISKNILDF